MRDLGPSANLEEPRPLRFGGIAFNGGVLGVEYCHSRTTSRRSVSLFPGVFLRSIQSANRRWEHQAAVPLCVGAGKPIAWRFRCSRICRSA